MTSKTKQDASADSPVTNLAKLRVEIETAVARNDKEGLAALEETARSLIAIETNSALIECLVILSTGWLQCGDVVRGRVLASFALDVARSFGAASSIRHALNGIAGAADAEGRMGLALRALTEAYRIAESAADKPAMIKSLANMGTCCGRAGLLNHSQKFYETARTLVEEARSELSLLDFFYSKCVLLVASIDNALSTGDLRQALQFAQQLKALKDESPKLLEEYDAYQTGVFKEQGSLFELIALSRLGMIAEANKIGHEVLGRLNSKTLLKRNERSALWALANLHRANGDLTSAISILRGLIDGPNNICQVARADLAACLRQAGEDAEAIQHWRELQRETGEARQYIAMEELRLIDGIGPNEDVLFDRTIEMAVALAETEAVFSARLRAKLRYLTDIAISAELPELHDRVEGHVEMIGHLAARVAAWVGCDAKTQWLAETAGRLHDVGKCAIPEHLRPRSATLSHEELELFRERASLGARLVEASNEPELLPVAEAIRNLHEHFDGSGYPAQRTGDEIPLLARVVAICERFVDMTEARPYREALSVEMALADISRNRGRQFDPEMCSALAKIAAETPSLLHKASRLSC